ncbi:MAG: hypothetical protein AB8H86_27350 [Polyangiales bacterium]
MPRFFFAICALFAFAAPAAAQRMEFDATPSEVTWPPAGEVSFEELCRGAARYLDEDESHHATCSVTTRNAEHVVVRLAMGAWLELHLFAHVAGRYRYIGTLESGPSQANHPTEVSILGIRRRTVNGQPFVFLRLQFRSGEYYQNGYEECEREHLRICGDSDAVDDCEMDIMTWRTCTSGPATGRRLESSWWRTRHVARVLAPRAQVEVSEDGLVYVTATRTEDRTTEERSVYRFAPPPPLPEPPPFIEGVCRATHEDEWRDRCDDRPRGHRYPVSLERHADFQALCDDARSSLLDITACSNESITRNLSIVRTRRDDEAGPTFLAERRAATIRLISRMSEPYPQPSELRFVRYVRGAGRYYGVEFEEHTTDAVSTRRRHLLVCRRGREARCSLRVPTRYSTQRQAHERVGVEDFSEAEAEIRRDGTLVLTRTSGSWAELFGMEPSPEEEERRVVYRL